MQSLQRKKIKFHFINHRLRFNEKSNQCSRRHTTWPIEIVNHRRRHMVSWTEPPAISQFWTELQQRGWMYRRWDLTQQAWRGRFNITIVVLPCLWSKAEEGEDSHLSAFTGNEAALVLLYERSAAGGEKRKAIRAIPPLPSFICSRNGM